MKRRWAGPWEESAEICWPSELNYSRPWPAKRLRRRQPQGRGCSDEILDEATRHHLFTDTFCRVCCAVLPFESQRMSHYEMDGTRIVENKYCNICNITLVSPGVALSHLQGKIHAKKLRQLAERRGLMEERSMQPVSETEMPSSSPKASLDLNYCWLCCVPFNSPFSAQEHYVGKKHGKNAARKKIMEELGIQPVPRESRTTGSFFSVIGLGHYMCPVCNVILTTIHEYQSHMQGKKHKTSLCRATKIRSLTKRSKKTYYSFQAQEATCLEERVDLRIAEEFQDGSLGEVKPSAFICEQDQHSSLFSETRTPTNTGKNRSPRCSSAGEHAQENTANCQYNTAHCVEGQASGAAATTDGFGLSAVESKEYCKLVLAETFSISYRKEQNLQVEYTEEKKYISQELRCKKEDSKLKRKEDSEGADLEKERKQRKRIKPDVDLVNEEKSRPNKDERLKKKPAKKQRKKRIKNQQASQIEIKTEHGAFWEDSGFIFW